MIVFHIDAIQIRDGYHQTSSVRPSTINGKSNPISQLLGHNQVPSDPISATKAPVPKLGFQLICQIRDRQFIALHNRTPNQYSCSDMSVLSVLRFRYTECIFFPRIHPNTPLQKGRCLQNIVHRLRNELIKDLCCRSHLYRPSHRFTCPFRFGGLTGSLPPWRGIPHLPHQRCSAAVGVTTSPGHGLVWFFWKCPLQTSSIVSSASFGGGRIGGRPGVNDNSRMQAVNTYCRACHNYGAWRSGSRSEPRAVERIARETEQKLDNEEILTDYSFPLIPGASVRMQEYYLKI
ncbi:hypothetical protein J6590_024121 [Homalodisca vitripennis]|nr:hypothetical protein J6590_024121 [Homalodisca vitripennis]